MLDGYVRRVTGVHPNTKCARCKIARYQGSSTVRKNARSHWSETLILVGMPFNPP